MAKASRNPLTDEDKATFVELFKKWQRLLNLMDWRYVKGRGKCRNLADVQIFHEDRVVRYRIGDDFGATPITHQSLDQVACHENLHVLFDPLIRASHDHGWDSPQVRELEHGVIAVLEKLLTQK